MTDLQIKIVLHMRSGADKISYLAFQIFILVEFNEIKSVKEDIKNL